MTETRLACGCVVGVAVSKQTVTEACPLHFEYAAASVEQALSSVQKPAAAPDRSKTDLEIAPLEMFPVELHKRTLHALLMAQLLSQWKGSLDTEYQRVQQERAAQMAIDILTVSREALSRVGL